ncbi:hypothetical protein [Acutalibacter muris]|nr:hypothetical protein [Acutalibacter muris]
METLIWTEVILLDTYQALEVVLDLLQLIVTMLLAFTIGSMKK